MEKKIIKLNCLLFKRYGNQGWWPTTAEPGKPPVYHPGDEDRVVSDNEAFEIIVGSVLTQNTSWVNAEKAITNLSAINLLTIRGIAESGEDMLANAIIPARYYNQKSFRLRGIAQNIINTGGIEVLKTCPTEKLRKLLLLWKGIGPETADSILCYAFGRPIFVVDAYTKRLFIRLSLPAESYQEIQDLVHQAIQPSASKYGDFHARIVKLFAMNEVESLTL